MKNVQSARMMSIDALSASQVTYWTRTTLANQHAIHLLKHLSMAYAKIVKALVNSALVKFTIVPSASQNLNSFCSGQILIDQTKLHVSSTAPQNTITHFRRIISLVFGKGLFAQLITQQIKQAIIVYLYCLSVLQVTSLMKIIPLVFQHLAPQFRFPSWLLQFLSAF